MKRVCPLETSMLRLILLLLMFTTPALAQAPNPSFNLVNRAAQPIVALHLSPAGHATFGARNWIAAPLDPGRKVAVRLPADGNCLFDLRATFADRTIEDQRTLNICKLEDVAFAGAHPKDDPSFTLINRASRAVAELSAVPPGQPAGTNRLTAPIAPGESRRVVLPRGACVYDVHVTFADHAGGKTRRNADLCRLGELTLVP
jgi:hypothetical protein